MRSASAAAARARRISRSSSEPCRSAAGEPRSSAPHPERLEHTGSRDTRRTASPPARRCVPRASRSRHSNRRAADPAVRSAHPARTAGPMHARADAGPSSPPGPAGSSRSITPSSAATSAASVVTSFVTDAQRTTSSRGAAGRDDVAVPRRHPQPRTTRASRRSAEVLPPPAGDTRRVDRRLVSSGSPYEPTIGFSRAVRDGRHVFVAGTCAVMPDGGDPPGDAYGQAGAAWRSSLPRSPRRAPRRSTSCARAPSSCDAADCGGGRPRPRRDLRRSAAGEHHARRLGAPRSALAGRDRG